MRILFVSNLYPPQWLGGYELLCKAVAEELAQRGHEIDVLTSTDMPLPTDAPSEPCSANVQVHRLLRLTWPFHEPRPWLLRARTLGVAAHNHGVTTRLVRQRRPHVAFVWSLLRVTPAPSRAASAGGIPVCHSLNDEHLAGFLPTPPRGPLSLARRLAEATWLKRHTSHGLDLRRVTCISRRVRDNLCRRGLPLQEARIIHQGVRLQAFPLAPPRPAGTPFRLLYVGQLQPYKGVQTAVEAVERLAGSATLTLAGDGFGPFQHALHARVRRTHGDIQLLGRIPHHQIGEVYRAHDAFVFPSIWEEPFGLTPLEAMASGLPVISTLGGGQGEYIRDQVNALAFEAGNAAQLASCVRRLCGDEALRRRLVEAGRATVEQGFRFERYVDELEGFLEEARGAARRPPLEVSA